MIPATIRQKREATHEEMISKSLKMLICHHHYIVTTAYILFANNHRYSKEEK